MEICISTLLRANHKDNQGAGENHLNKEEILTDNI